MRVVELKMPLVVEFEQGGAVWVLLLQVDIVDLGLLGRVAAILAHVNLEMGENEYNVRLSSCLNSHLRSSLLVIVTVVDPMYF